MAGKHKVRKGRGGRALGGSKGMSTTPFAAGKVIYCEKCGSTGQHYSVREVGLCYGGAYVLLGRDYRWVRP